MGGRVEDAGRGPEFLDLLQHAGRAQAVDGADLGVHRHPGREQDGESQRGQRNQQGPGRNEVAACGRVDMTLV